MAIADRNRVYDGFASLAGGMDAGRRPDVIGEDQYAAGENLVCRGGLVTTRPGFVDLAHPHESNVTYLPDGLNGGGTTGTTSLVAYSFDVFQGAHYYAPVSGEEMMVAMIGGRFFALRPRANNILSIREFPLEKRNSSARKIAYMMQADRFLIAQDGESSAIIFDGVSARRATEGEVPVGTLMAYGMGRLVVVAPNRRDIYFGDLYGSHAEMADAGESVLRFEESTFLNEGFPASVTTAMGKIKAMIFAPQQDTATGDGELLVLPERGIASFFLSLPREQWKESNFQRVTLLNEGAMGHRMIETVNGDVWYRAQDGLRSYRQARAEIAGWARLPMSTEVRPWLDSDTEELLEYGSMIHFGNRLISTCTPQPNQGRLFHDGMVSLDFDVLSSFGGASRPAWDGHWSKMKVLQLVSGMFAGVERAFVFAINNAGENHVYELSRNEPRDYDAAISWELVGRSMLFGDGEREMPFNEKRLYGADVWIDNIRDTITLALDYKPDQRPDWVPWQTLGAIAPVGACGATDCAGKPTFRANYSPRRRIGKPPEACDASFTGRSYARGFEFQPRLKGTGHASIRRFRLHAQMETEEAKGSC